jgi:hypothetical protein
VDLKESFSFCLFSDGQLFIRARTREEAKAKVREELGDDTARFCR